MQSRDCAEHIHAPDTHLQTLECSALLRSSLSPTITSHPGRLVGTSVQAQEGGIGGREKQLRDGGRRERERGRRERGRGEGCEGGERE